MNQTKIMCADDGNNRKDTKSKSKVEFPTTEKIPITRKRNVR